MTEDPVDLDRYFARIGYTGPRAPTLEVLSALQALHTAAIPFEAIDVLLDRGIDLAPEAVDAKLLDRGRGGYCFEQNGLLRRVLLCLGFEVEGLLARVLWMRGPEDPPLPRTHMILKVAAGGVWWLVDVGFGHAVPTAPLRWDTDARQDTAFGRFRLRDEGLTRVLETDLAEDWAPAYRISVEPAFEIDFAVANWFTSMHPGSHFRNNLIVTRATPERRAALLGNRLTLRPRGGAPVREFLDADGMERALAEIFGLPVEPDWRPILEKAAQPG